MTPDNMIEEAILLATSKHAGQRDGQGMPYILHPLRVMDMVFREVGLKPEFLATAVLHDVVEDCDVTIEDLEKAGFPESVVSAIKAVSKRESWDKETKKENYIEFVRRASLNPIGRIVKKADITDNRGRIPAKLNSDWWKKLNVKYTVGLAVLNHDAEWLHVNRELVAGLEAQ